MKKAADLIRKTFCEFYLDNNPDYKASVFLAGTGRSGTTFVEDIINYRGDYRVMFEPFHPYKVKICRNFRYRQYLRPDNKDPGYIEPARAILSGRIRNIWVDQYNKRRVYSKRLVKDIRANHLLKWIHVNFPGVPVVLLLRHPCAVAYSKIRFKWGSHLEEFLSQPELMEDFLDPFRKQIEGARTDLEKHIFLWCIENYVPLKQFKKGEVHLAFYENFCARPEYEIGRLASFLGIDFDEKIVESMQRPSDTTRKDSAIITGKDLVESWRDHISNDDTRKAIEILSLFGLDSIYSQDPMPDAEGAYKLMRSS